MKNSNSKSKIKIKSPDEKELFLPNRSSAKTSKGDFYLEAIMRNDKKEAAWLMVIVFILFLILVAGCDYAYSAVDTTKAVRAVIGEASNQGYRGMLDVAVGIRNRGTLKGVYGVTAKHVDKEPQWVWKMARKAWRESEYNRTHSG